MSDKASIITLNCLISGEEANDVFGIKISCEGVSNSNDNRVSILADKIRNCRLDLFKDTDSSKLILYMNKAEADSVVILGLKNDKGAILNEKRLITEVIYPEQKRHKPVTFPELELALKEFVLNYQHRTILSDAILVEKAKLLANGLGVPENMLQFSSGWLQGFKKRNGIRQEKLQGETASANETAIMEALPLLHNKCVNYPLERIYNMDETGLFYQTRSNTSYKTSFWMKESKERLSIALCSNADGSHKLPPLIIGKYANPRCFKNINIYNLPMTYRNNAKAWMLITIFQEWLHEFDHQVALKHGGQRVLLLLDNCTSHKVENLALLHVEIQFLPPNTTSKIQPMDARIIMSFKKHYRHHHIRWLLEQVEAGQNIQDLKIDILQAIR
ncbi:16801_t:CDS:2, partial [Rhizophagus irregularis]